MNVQERLEEFKQLEKGWHFGDGDPIAQTSFDIVNELITVGGAPQFEVMEVFPHIDGGIRICFYRDDLYLEFDVYPNGQIDYRKEIDDKLIEETENIDKSTAMLILLANL